jgi:two-component system nitrate/nitrite response regulator NarL
MQRLPDAPFSVIPPACEEKNISYSFRCAAPHVVRQRAVGVQQRCAQSSQRSECESVCASNSALNLSQLAIALPADAKLKSSGWKLSYTCWVHYYPDEHLSQGAALQIRVFIVSNVRLHREGLVAQLRGCPSIEVLGAADSVQETQNVLRTTATDVALIDVALIDALSPSDSDMVGALRKMCARMRILAFGIRETASEVLACAAAGIDGYVPMDAALGDMVTAIENVVRGELTCSPKVAASLYHCIGFARAAAASPLTTRELQVADLMNRGCPTKEIAWRLGVQPCTAKNHVRNILHKLQVHGRGQAVAKLRTLIGERFGVG